MNYDALALKIVPPNSNMGVVWIRKQIARHMAAEVEDALRRQREEKFPELAAAREELEGLRKRVMKENEADVSRAADQIDAMKKKHKKYVEEIEAMKVRLSEWENNLVGREAKIAKLEPALESYFSWLDGNGGVDENGSRFEAMRLAYLSYKGKR